MKVLKFLFPESGFLSVDFLNFELFHLLFVARLLFFVFGSVGFLVFFVMGSANNEIISRRMLTAPNPYPNPDQLIDLWTD